MGNAELKLDIFRIVDRLSESELQKLHSMVSDLVSGQSADTLPWDRLSEGEQSAIEQGLSQLDRGKGLSHQHVMSEFRKKYSQ